ncbi:MAG: HEPN domain-containing protein [Planctomycetales bacterium]|nr:HEPN domain-containing protein [Planctomycetales bacterium]
MKRNEWQQLATDRLQDAEILLDNGRWQAAYYLAGYAVECALKSCIVRYVQANAEVIFKEPGYQNKCWTHNLDVLIERTGFEGDLKDEIANNADFGGYWGVVSEWTESSRYNSQITETEAKDLYAAIGHDPDGVMRWLQNRW